jgi:hypothetical protein
MWLMPFSCSRKWLYQTVNYSFPVVFFSRGMVLHEILLTSFSQTQNETLTGDIVSSSRSGGEGVVGGTEAPPLEIGYCSLASCYIPRDPQFFF